MSIEREVKGSNKVSSGEQFAEQITSFRTKYDKLLAALGAVGTEASRDRVMETDLDIAPYRFVRNGRHIFIFPPQPDADYEEKSFALEGTKPYTLRQETREVKFDEDLVTGYLNVYYEDSGNVPELYVREMWIRPSEFPHEVLLAIDEAFTQTSS